MEALLRGVHHACLVDHLVHDDNQNHHYIYFELSSYSGSSRKWLNLKMLFIVVDDKYLVDTCVLLLDRVIPDPASERVILFVETLLMMSFLHHIWDKRTQMQKDEIL